MKKFIKNKMAVGIIAVCLMITSVISVSGLGIQHVSTDSNLFSNYIKAGFLEGYKGTGSYGTNTKKVVKRCYVRLVEGTYDSGRKFSNIGKKKVTGKMLWTPKVSKTNQIGHTCYTYYNWLYY